MGPVSRAGFGTDFWKYERTSDCSLFTGVCEVSEDEDRESNSTCDAGVIGVGRRGGFARRCGVTGVRSDDRDVGGG